MQLRENFERIRADKLLLTWNVVIALVAAVPLLIFVVARAGIQGNYEDDEGQQDQQQYDYYGNPYKNHWWQFWRKANPYAQYEDDQGQNQDQNQEGGAPWWCKFFLP